MAGLVIWDAITLIMTSLSCDIAIVYIVTNLSDLNTIVALYFRAKIKNTTILKSKITKYVHMHVYTDTNRILNRKSVLVKWNEALGLRAFLWQTCLTHICVNKLTIIGSDHGLSHGRRQAIIWTRILLIRTLETNFSEILSEIHSFSFKKMYLKMSSAKWRLFRLCLNALKGAWTMNEWMICAPNTGA